MDEISVQGAAMEGNEPGNAGVPTPIFQKSVAHTTGHFDTILKAKFRSALVVVTYECQDVPNFTRSDLLLLGVVAKDFAPCKFVPVASVGSSTGVKGDIEKVEYKFEADDTHLNATLKAKVTRIGNTEAANCTVSGFVYALG